MTYECGPGRAGGTCGTTTDVGQHGDVHRRAPFWWCHWGVCACRCVCVGGEGRLQVIEVVRAFPSRHASRVMNLPDSTQVAFVSFQQPDEADGLVALAASQPLFPGESVREGVVPLPT